HVALGAFGTGKKAARVIPHKLWQGLAAGRAVVTGDGPGPREAFADGVHLRLTPRGDAAALAQALADLIASPAEPQRLGAAGRARGGARARGGGGAGAGRGGGPARWGGRPARGGAGGAGEMPREPIDGPPLRIAHLDTGRSWRGGQAQVLLLMRELDARGHEQ